MSSALSTLHIAEGCRTPSALHTSINDVYAADWLPFQEKKLNPRCAQLLCNLGRASPMVDLDRTKRWSS